MYSKVVFRFLLIIILITPLAECEDWCSLIISNGTYRGLGAYHRWFAKNENGSEFVMFNRDGSEWKFTIEGSAGKDLNNMTIKVDTNSLKIVSDSNVVHKIGIYLYNPHGFEKLLYQCHLISYVMIGQISYVL